MRSNIAKRGRSQCYSHGNEEMWQVSSAQDILQWVQSREEVMLFMNEIIDKTLGAMEEQSKRQYWRRSRWPSHQLKLSIGSWNLLSRCQMMKWHTKSTGKLLVSS